MSRIYIDPGHGGQDGGADGPSGLRESDCVLDIALTLGDLLEADNALIVRHSRVDDSYPDLEERCADANEWEADYFISVHCNSDGPDARGIETLVQQAGSTAHKLAQCVQEELVKATGDIDRGIKYRTDLAVLNGTQMPAILVECGFISHPETETKLKTDDHRYILADAIHAGIQKFLASV